MNLSKKDRKTNKKQKKLTSVYLIFLLKIRRKKKMNKKQTSKKVASIASGILRDGRTSSKSKTVAASALSQTRKGGK